MAIEINHDAASQATEADFAVIAAATEQIQHSGRAAELVFRANARRAAEEIVNLAHSAANERVRLDAAKYIVERVMGKISEAKDLDAKDDAPWTGVYGAVVVREPSAEERASNTRAITAGRPTPQTKAAPQSHQ
jgi:hypothetical protein